MHPHRTNDRYDELYSLMDSSGINPWLREQFRKCIDFHTFPAPGLLIGVFMVDYALEILGATPDEKLYAVSETHKCAPDPLQVITHCTTGNHRLRVIPIGKFAITLNPASDDPEAQGVRVYVDPVKVRRYPTLSSWYTKDPSFQNKSMEKTLLEEILSAGRTILSYELVRVSVTPKQPWKAVPCPSCGEMVPDDMLEGGKCAGCSSDTYYKTIPGGDYTSHGAERPHA